MISLTLVLLTAVNFHREHLKHLTNIDSKAKQKYNKKRIILTQHSEILNSVELHGTKKKSNDQQTDCCL